MLGAFNIFGPSAQSKPAASSPDTPVTNERVVDLKTLIFFGKYVKYVLCVSKKNNSYGLFIFISEGIALNYGSFATWWNTCKFARDLMSLVFQWNSFRNDMMYSYRSRFL